MHVAVGVVLRGQLENREHFVGRRTGAVGQPETNADGSGVESGGDVLLQGFQLFRRKRLCQSFALEPRVRPRHDDVAGVGVANGRTVIKYRFAFTFGVKSRDILNADFELECARNPIMDLGAVVFGAMPVPVHVDEACGDDMPTGLEHLRPADLFFAENGDFPVLDSHMAHGIQTGLGVHNAAVSDDDVVGGRRGAGKKKQRQAEGKKGAQHGDQYGSESWGVQLV